MAIVLKFPGSRINHLQELCVEHHERQHRVVRFRYRSFDAF